MTGTPRNIEAEQALLGAILVDNRAMALVAGALKAEHFSDPVHARIFEVAANMVAAGLKVNPITLKSALPDGVQIGGMDLPRYTVRLAAEAAAPADAAHFGQVIYDLAMRRAALAIGEALARDARDNEAAMPPADAVRAALDALSDLPLAAGPLGGEIARRRPHSLYEAYLELRQALGDPAPERAAPTGLADLDRMLGGWQRGAMVVVAARPSMGKTAFVLSTMMRAVGEGDAAVFSMEMDARQVAARCVSDLAYVRGDPLHYVRLMPGREAGLSERDVGRVWDLDEAVRGLGVHLDDRAGLTVAEIAAAARRFAQKAAARGRRLSVVYVDYLGLVRSSDRYAGNKVQETGEISAALKKLAKDLDVAVVALSQLSRAVEQRDDKRPMLADLRNSGDIEQDADAVLFLYREAYYLARQTGKDSDAELDRRARLEALEHVMEIGVAKNRNGPIGTVEAWCDMGSNVVRDPARPERGEV